MKQMEVSILGQSYILACPDGGERNLLDAVSRVDAEMSKIRDAGKIRARERMAVLAALNLAYSLAETPPVIAGVDPAVVAADDAKVAQLIARVDQALQDDGRLL